MRLIICCATAAVRVFRAAVRCDTHLQPINPPGARVNSCDRPLRRRESP